MQATLIFVSKNTMYLPYLKIDLVSFLKAHLNFKLFLMHSTRKKFPRTCANNDRQVLHLQLRSLDRDLSVRIYT